MAVGKQLVQVRIGFVLVAALFLASLQPLAAQDDSLTPDAGPALLAEVVVTENGGFELYSVRPSTDAHILMAALTPADIDAAKALAERLGQGVQILPLEDDEVSAQLALRLPQVFAVTTTQCALVGYYPDGKSGTVFFDC